MTPAFERYIEPARRRPQLWRVALGLVLIVVIYVIPLAGIAFLPDLPPQVENFLDHLLIGPWLTLVILASFLPAILGVIVAVRLLHRRSAASLIGPRRPAFRDFLITAGVMLGLAAIASVLASIFAPPEEGIYRNLPLIVWLAFLPLGVLGILVQTGAEELIFRGYLQQQLAARFRSPLIWMLLPSILFGALHYNPLEMGGNSLLVVFVTGLVGLLAADLTARTGTLGAAWGLHAANNALALLFVAAPGPLGGLGLWVRQMPQSAPEMIPLLLLDVASLLVIWAVARRLLRR
ncbi:CPBP family intramembrane glutamic endopeptidase [Halodurantibacterium flavum]|uniref:CPBP family intramembrane glutamic endopeptidase n=1 Tax=Halodurantibacterium flavum TaxID=1382802 RepID=A0ABW4SAA1_9RHOB